MGPATAKDARFTCGRCTRCCRGIFVQLLPGEAERLAALAWPAGDPLAGRTTTLPLAGGVALAHEADGACVYLDSERAVCRIHERFGEEAKPYGCRLFPLQLGRLPDGRLSASRRAYCPTVRANEGAPLAAGLSALSRLAAQGPQPSPIDAEVLCGATPEGASRWLVSLQEVVRSAADARSAAYAMALRIAYLEPLGGRVLSSRAADKLFEAARALPRAPEAGALPPPPSFPLRFAFRALLALTLRRDEDVLHGRASRLRRGLAHGLFAAGFGDARDLGLDHGRGPVRAAGLFRHDRLDGLGTADAALRRLLEERLETAHLLGAPAGGRFLFAGLRALALFVPLALATARLHAAGRGRFPEAPDLDHALGAVDHGFWRGAPVKLALGRRLERECTRDAALASLIAWA